MNKYLFLTGLILLFIVAWQMGEPKSPPPLTINLDAFKVRGEVKGVEKDSMAPISQLNEFFEPIGRGNIISGIFSDLGSGVAGVVIQIQRVKDGAVWDGNAWQVSAGSYQNAIIAGNSFSYQIPVELIKGEKYIIRSQAIDNFGNAQTKWSEITVEGKDLGQTQVN